MMMHSKLKLVGFILVVLILFSGCISGNKGESTSTQSTGTEPVHYGPITPALEFTPVTPTPVWASKDVELQGDVYGIAVGTSSGPIPYIHTIQFKIKLATGGGPRDISRSKLTWQTKTILRNLDYGGTGSPDPLLYQWKIDMLTDLFNSIKAMGTRVIIGVSGHNIPQQIAMINKAMEPVIADGTITGIGLWEITLSQGPESDSDHAAKWETSNMMYLYPDLVDLKELGHGPLAPDMQPPDGIGGLDPRKYASAEIGRKNIELAAAAIGKKAKELLGSLPEERRTFNLSVFCPPNWWQI